MRSVLAAALLLGDLLLPACSASPATPITLHPDTGRIQVAGSSLFFERAGSGTPVILLHAGYLNRRMWDPQFAALAQTHLVIRHDARGLGRSGPARTPFSQAEDLHQLLLALGLSKASLVGCSLGGATALDFAVTYPQMVDRLVLVAPGLTGYRWPPVDLQEPWRVEARAALARHDTAGVARAWAHSDYLAPAARSPALAALLDTLLEDNVPYWKGVMVDQQTWDTDPNPPTLARLREIHVPTLLLLGTADVPDIQAIGDTLARSLANLQIVRFPDVGHLPNLERPDSFLAVVRAFLATP